MERRRALGLSQFELAAKAGVSINTVQRIEHRKHRPRHLTLVALARVLQMRPNDLMALIQNGREVNA